jgi:hypothetical protein
MWSLQFKEDKKELQFDGKVMSVRFDKSPDDIYLLDDLTYTIDPDDPRRVQVMAKFSWGGAVVLTWDFDLQVMATVESIILVREEYKEKFVVSKQRIETVRRTVTDVDKRMVEVVPALEEKIYKRTKDQIRKSLTDELILSMT